MGNHPQIKVLVWGKRRKKKPADVVLEKMSELVLRELIVAVRSTPTTAADSKSCPKYYTFQNSIIVQVAKVYYRIKDARRVKCIKDSCPKECIPEAVLIISQYTRTFDAPQNHCILSVFLNIS